MRTFVFGAVVGAMAMYFYLQGFGVVIDVARGWWTRVSAPHASALQQ
jgi:hypothetical protein